MASEAVQIVADAMVFHQSKGMCRRDAHHALLAIRAALDAGNEDVATALGLTVERQYRHAPFRRQRRFVTPWVDGPPLLSEAKP